VTAPDTTYPRPGVADWLLLAIGILFVVCGLIVLPHNRDVGIVTIALFGPCAAVFATIILRKMRFRRVRVLKAEIVGGVPIRVSGAAFLTTSAALTIICAISVVFGRSYGVIFWALAWMFALAGCVLLIGFFAGWFANDYVQFDPEGITFGRRRFAFTVPWDGISWVSAGSLHNNPAAFMWLHSLDAVRVHPIARRDRALKHLAFNAGWAGRPSCCSRRAMASIFRCS